MISRIYYGGNIGCQNVDIFLRLLAYELENICGRKLELENDTRKGWIVFCLQGTGQFEPL